MINSPFRPVHLPSNVPGRLYLTCMPGYHHEAPHHLDHWATLKGTDTPYVLCLAGEPERKRKAPDYGAFVNEIEIGGHWLEFPIEDRSVPREAAEFVKLLGRLSEILLSPTSLLVIHCAAGVGRTGTTAIALLVRMGLPPNEAQALIKDAGSEPETELQRRFALSF